MTALIAVYRDEDDARAVASRLQDTLPAAVEVAGDRDHETSIRAEMEAEVDESWGSPGVGVFLTAEQMRGAVLVSLGGGALGGLIGMPIGLLLTSWTLPWQLGIGALIGVLFGATVGALLGGGFAMQSAMHAPAAQQGYTVRVVPGSDAAEQVMVAAKPIRIDRVASGQRVSTPTTEGPSGLRENVRDTADKLVEHSRDERRR